MTQMVVYPSILTKSPTFTDLTHQSGCLGQDENAFILPCPLSMLIKIDEMPCESVQVFYLEKTDPVTRES